MKRVLSFILALTMTLTLCACGSGSGKLSPYLMDFQFGAGEDATEKTILDLEKNDTCCSASPVEPAEAVETKPTEETAEENNTPQPLEVKETE